MDAHNVTERRLAALASFIATWPGRRLGPHGLVTVINEHGHRPPLVWVFNATHEMPALAAALGEDQPLIALRSLNVAVNIYQLTTWDERILARLLAGDVARLLRGRACHVGGNCQGARVAAELTRELLLLKQDVQGYIGMEWPDLAPLPLACTMLFGRESEQHNPFLQGRDPWPLWRRLYADVHCDLLPGTHGGYFAPERIPALAAAIHRAVSRPPTAPAPGAPEAEPQRLPTTVDAGAVLHAELAADAELQPGEDLAFLWDGHFASRPHRQVATPMRSDDGGWQLAVTAPDVPGTWTLQTFRCLDGHGPRTWSHDTQRYRRIAVAPLSAPIPRC